MHYLQVFLLCSTSAQLGLLQPIEELIGSILLHSNVRELMESKTRAIIELYQIRGAAFIHNKVEATKANF